MLLITPPVRLFAGDPHGRAAARAPAPSASTTSSTRLRSCRTRPARIELAGRDGEVALRARALRLHVDRAGARATSTLTVAPGETVALVGSSGSGKSTVAPDAAALLRRARGRGHDRRHRRARRDARVAAPAASASSSRTRSCSPTRSPRNIAFGRPDATEAEIEARGARGRSPRVHPAAAARLRHRRRRAGPHAVGRPAAAGRARTGAALRPAILLLDDATSSVDARIEEEIHATLRRIASGRTTILVAHRSRRCRSPIASWCRQGAVLDVGTHDELWRALPAVPHAALGPGRRRRGHRAVDESSTTTTRGGTA